jgi:TPP-dependent pyruvate/acetoin dehydrogenase alpha subunit
LIEVSTDRYLGHFQGDAEAYRPQDEVNKLRENDPLDRLQKQLKKDGISETEISQIQERTKTAVQEAYDFARESAYPDVSEATQHVFV